MEDLFSPLHLVIVLVIVLLIFGPKRLPELGSGIGKSIRGFRDSLSGESPVTETQTAATVNQAASQAGPSTPADRAV